MGKPAARLTDMHVCPMLTPGLPPIPHVGGPIVGPGCPTVLIGGMPAAVMGDMCVCVGPPDTIILGSTGVFFGGKPATRMGDQCAHGGSIVLGCPTVMIGEIMPGSPVPPLVPVPGVSVQAAMAQAMKVAAVNGDMHAHLPIPAPPEKKAAPVQIEKGKLDFALIDHDEKPVEGINYEVTLSDGSIRRGKTDKEGRVKLQGIPLGSCQVSFPDLDQSEWV
jgi:uncharacterized Zn-binding protein involved in type VI secretion